MIPCSHGMPTPAACTECMADGNIPPPPKPRTAWSRPVEARFAGRCVLCDDRIERGDLIRVHDARIAHDGCAVENGADG